MLAAVATLHARVEALDVQLARVLAAQERTNRLLELALHAGFEAEEELRRR
jgi:hypothetical protein